MPRLTRKPATRGSISRGTKARGRMGPKGRLSADPKDRFRAFTGGARGKPPRFPGRTGGR